MYTGFFMPDGGIPNIMNDGRKAQKAEMFITNQETAQMYMWRLLDIAMSVFEWENLPKGIDQRQLEFWLLRDGFCGMLYDEDLKVDSRRAPEGYAVLPMMIRGNWDIYDYPKERTAYATNGLQYQCNEDNSVIIFNDYLRTPMWFTLKQYAYRLAMCDRTIDVNLAAQKTPKIIRCTESQRLSLLNLAKEVDENKNWITADKNLDIEGIQIFDTSAPFVALDVQVLKHQYWNEVLTYLGIENVNTDKKERLITDEVMSNMGDVEGQRFVRLNARKQACEMINELWGLNVDCNFRTGIYIKADGFGDTRIPVSGMEDKTFNYEGGENE